MMISRTRLVSGLFNTIKNNKSLFNVSFQQQQQQKRLYSTSVDNKNDNQQSLDINNSNIEKNPDILLKYVPTDKAHSFESQQFNSHIENNNNQKWYLKLLGIYSKDTVSLHNSYSIYEAIARTSSDIRFYRDFNLPINVRSWFAVSCVHLWIVLVRLRKDINTSKQLSSDLYDRYWEDLETKIHIGGIKKRFISKYLKDFYNSYLGAVISYDEGLFDDTILANALWRNFFAMAPETSSADLLRMVKYIRLQLNHIDNLENISSKGQINFLDLSKA
ncbi:hypothetical protein CYY_001096 [Polysphondylium violaceum]|uniref:Ubiquinol-cytochrome c chaperone domain-containing protein n=1 Tax=Polysphondylium violaceum TaxID=133409 RepID=A0A8J4Q0F7_9MYCE|nr:hypothetical protein CYY_001096 [Polysphondylium violaceum]